METKEKSTAISMDNKENLRKVISILKYPVISDKSTRLLESNKYTFMVDRRAIKLPLKKLLNISLTWM